MPVATATVQVDDDGVVRGLRTMQSEFRELGDAADDAGEGVDGFEEKTSSAVGRMDQYNQSVEEGFGLTRQFADAQEQLAQGGTDVVQSMERQADAVQQVKSQQRQLSTASSKYNQIVFSTGDLVQDLQFGLRGAGNNIAFMAENFAEASQGAGGFKSVLNGVFSSLKGPAGIILGIQTLIALGPQIASFFSDQEKNAEEFGKALDDAAGNMLSFKEEIAGFEVETLEQAKQARDTLQNRVESRQEEIGIVEKLINQQDVEREGLTGAGNLLQENQRERAKELGLLDAGLETLRNRRDVLESELRTFKSSRDSAENMVQGRKAALKVEDSLRETVAEQAEEQRDANSAIAEYGRIQEEVIETEAPEFDTEILPDFDFVEEAGQLLEDDLVGNLKQAEFFLSELKKERRTAEGERLGQINRIIGGYEDLQTELQNTGTETKKTFADSIGGVSDLESKLETGAVDSINKANAAISVLDKKFADATSDKQRERIAGLRGSFQDLRDEMQGAGEDQKQMETTMGGVIGSMDQQATLANALTENFVQFGKAIGQGERVMDAFGDAALGVLSSVGTAMGKQMIAQGSALVASALIPGLQGNAIAGGKLIAAGTALIAASQALSGLTSDSGGGGGGGSGGSDGADIEGGGRSNTEVTAPGRRRGGPVQGGRLYETHGLGEREYFMPERDGRIVTANQMGATDRSQKVEVRNEVSSNLGVEDAQVDFDIGELRFRLDELETKVQKVT